jgi:protein-S-isoprenylcysteine O-methyltransferase Ste14
MSITPTQEPDPRVDMPRLPHPGVRFPPPFVFVAGFVGGLALERWHRRTLPGGDDVRGLSVVVGWLAILVGLLLAGWALLVFFRAHTAIIPIHPASRLVASGPYRFSRNPMYVGLSILYIGLALLFNVAWPIVLFPLVILSLYHLVIRREERYLADAFGEAYRTYCQRVRRWL